MKLRVGQTLSSAVDNTAVIITRAPEGDVELTCGGVPMLAPGTEAGPATADPNQLTGTLLGKRYTDDAATIELLCTKNGLGTLALDGSPLAVQAAKPLPSSD
ncbi:hypothetical protein LRP67_02940 [Nocardioides sp. cx-169]|uniref:hypothetical protein n=1 Tax=Nocardioides sp. cx-169 TaxID=2899080 RepID=UPI001E3290D9|nr:hypothetical protein [Nocardioides sp. cx-169]MCD4533036.1 hypothetical protein [Nocardioides sp. cx-169]